MIASILVIPHTKAPELETGDAKTRKSWVSRIDFAGSLLLGAGILLLILPVEIGGVKVPWTHPIIFGLFGAGILALTVFVINEEQWAENPAFPLHLIKNRDILSPYIAMCCTAGAQTSVRSYQAPLSAPFQLTCHGQLMYFVPLYFQVTARVSNTTAGLHLVPAVVGNTIGGLISGNFIRR